jgi:hypothetical protein
MNFNRTTRYNRKPMIRGLVFWMAVFQLLTVCITPLFLVGCGPNRYIIVSPTSPESDSATGNWQIAVTTSGTLPFSALTGSVLQGTPQTDGQTSLFAVLQTLNPSDCFRGVTTVPLEGSLTGTSFSLSSLSDSGQYLNITGVSESNANAFTGSFVIDDGCANGTTGNLSGIKIAPLTGDYSGPWDAGTGNRTMSLALSQYSFADGFGYFHLQGTATFTGVSCFSTGTLESAQSTISGQQVLLTITTSGITPSTVTLLGTVDPAADSLTLTSIQILGGCAGNAGTATLVS